MKRKIFYRPLLAALLTQSSSALVEILGAWHEYDVTAVASDGVPPSKEYVRTGTGAVPGTVTAGAALVKVLDPAAANPISTRASIQFWQTGSLLENGVSCRGSTIGIRDGEYFASVRSVSNFCCRFRVSLQEETIALNRRQFDIVNPNSSGTYALGGNLSNGQVVSPSDTHGPKTLTPGDYEIRVGIVLDDRGFVYNTGPQTRSYAWDFDLVFSNVVFPPGSSQANPRMPDQVIPGPAPDPGQPAPGSTWRFNNQRGFQWFDPPVAKGFAFGGNSGTRFSRIVAAPSGFDRPFHVFVGGTKIGEVTGGQSFNFQEVTGQPVSSFEIRNIHPFVPRDSATAFPVMLAFDTDTGSFDMTPLDGPWVDLKQLPGGQFQIEWGGELQKSTTLTGWEPWVPATNPFTWTPAAGQTEEFFRASTPD